MSTQSGLGKIQRTAKVSWRLTAVAALLLGGLVMASVGYYGPWVAHKTAALALSGIDLGEFVKFLPGVRDGSQAIIRQVFYLPPFSVVVAVALLIGSRRLAYPSLLRVVVLLLAVPVSLQLLPPAWSLSTLRTPEFRVQGMALGLCWLLLSLFWLLARLPAWLSGGLSAVLATASLVLSGWQFLAIWPAIGEVYGSVPTLGWGFVTSSLGLLFITVASVLLVLWASRRSGSAWTSG